MKMLAGNDFSDSFLLDKVNKSSIIRYETAEIMQEFRPLIIYIHKP